MVRVRASPACFQFATAGPKGPNFIQHGELPNAQVENCLACRRRRFVGVADRRVRRHRYRRVGRRSANFSFTTPTALVPITSAGGTSLSFNLTAPKKLLITFSAECSSSGTAGWVDIDVLVDGVAQAPTNQTADAFCSNNTTVGHDGWVRGSVTLVTGSIPIGAHTVSILGRINAGSTGGWLSDTATVVQK